MTASPPSKPNAEHIGKLSTETNSRPPSLIQNSINFGYRPIPVFSDGKTAPYGRGQTYSADADQWGNAIYPALALDNLILIDVDGNKGAAISPDEFANHFGIDDRTMADALFQWNAAGDSRHYLFKWPAHIPHTSDYYQSRDGILEINGKRHLDMKTGNQLVHLKPGKQINWRPAIGWSNAPDKLVEFFRKPERNTAKPPNPSPPKTLTNGDGTPYGLSALRSACDAVRGAADGGRNAALNAQACAMGSLIAGGELMEQVVRAELETAAAAVGLHPNETLATIQSGMSAGLQNPRSAPRPERPPCPRPTNDEADRDALQTDIAAWQNGQSASPVPANNGDSPPPNGVEEELDYTRVEPKRNPAMFPSLLGEIVTATTTRTEAVPVAVAINFLSRLAAMIGRPTEINPDAPILFVGDSVVNCRLFAIVCGDTGKGRKGTSDKPVQRIFDVVNQAAESCPANAYHPMRLNTHTGGLSSGEGIAYRLRDAAPETGNTEADQNRDMGVSDKRLHIVEEEFANVITQCQRETNILSSVLRCVFDGGTIYPLTKHHRTIATNPHVCIVGHITAHELIKKTTGTDVANGFLNRFMLLHTKRERIDPFPERTADDVIQGFADRVMEIVRFAHGAGRITFTTNAHDLWEDLYHQLTTLDDGHTLNFLLARSELYCLTLAMLFALVDCRKQISVPDLEAAYAWVRYWRHSLIYIFDGERAKVEAEKRAEFAETVYQAIASINGGQGCTQTEIYRHFNCHRPSAEIATAVEYLMTTTPPRVAVQNVRVNPHAKRPTKMYSKT